jgi:hypothetical protein
MGASSVQYPTWEPATALPNLVKLELQEALPGTTWQTSAALLYPTPRMAERAASLIERHKPHAVYFVCSAVYAEETVLFSIQRRWPRWFPAANAIEKRLEGAGGSPAAPSSLKGRLFRAARAGVRRATGVAPLVDLDDAIESTVRTLRAMATVEGLIVACRLSAGGVRDASQEREVRQRIDAYNAAVGSECASLGFASLDVVGEMRRAGLEYTFEADRIHGNLEARQFSARFAAAAIQERLLTAPHAPLTKRVP